MSELSTRPAWADLIDLASVRLGGKVLARSDDFFAPASNLLKPEPAIFIPGKFTTRGKWMDGWESRRKRTPGHDWCIIQLGAPGLIRGILIDTAHFNGNQPESCTIEGLDSPSLREGAGGRARAASSTSKILSAGWTEIIPRSPLGPSREHYVPATTTDRRFTHVRLNIFPDGGVARLRLFGEVQPDWPALLKRPGPLEVSSALLGGQVVAANDMHFGSRHNLIMPDRPANMGDGWETRRKRNLTWINNQPAEHDWAIIKLGRRSTLTRIDVATTHFKGNFPESCTLEACDTTDTIPPPTAHWQPLASRTKLKANANHPFAKLATHSTPFTHVKLTIYPDGGISRLKVWGSPIK